jgi:dienelactone hydrolase
MRVVALVAALITSACCTSLPGVRGTKRQPPPESTARFEVETESLVWNDTVRNREVPAKIYSPAGARRPLPLVIFSHGIGEDRESYEYLGRALARAGFVAVHVTHAGTDRATLERGYRHLYRATKNKDNWRARALDVTHAIDRMVQRPDIDAQRIAVVGHSAGAWAAFTAAGMVTNQREWLGDARVKAIVPMSMPRMDGIVPRDGYNRISIPVLNITGTCDTSLVYRTFPKHRRAPFEWTTAKQQYLVTIERLNHDHFSALQDRRHSALERLTVGFLRAFLLDDAAARAWFDETGLGEVDGERLTVEKK